jgi:hypothetical protein
MTNAGLIEATGAAGLTIISSTTITASTITNTGGTIKASGAGAFVTIGVVVDVVGGTLSTDTGGTIRTGNGTGSNTLDVPTINNAANLVVSDNSNLTIGGTITNTGTVALNSVGNATQLIIDSNNLTLQGGGAVMLSDAGSNANRIYGAVAADTLTNVNNTISGAGQLGFGQLTLINQAGGTINASGANQLVINTGASGSLTNAGLIEATGAAGLVITSSNVNNTGGTIEAAAGSSVDLESVTINGGTLESIGSGALRSTTGDTFDNVTVVGKLQIPDNTTLHMGGAINNTGTILLKSAGNATTLILDGAGATFTGGGTITLTDQNVNANRIYGATGSAVLNNVDNTIAGSGQLGDAQLQIVNGAGGTIDANGTNGLVVNATFGSAIVNNGTLEAAGGTLTVDNNVTGVGWAEISGNGQIIFNGQFQEMLDFVGAGKATLTQSQALPYGGTISGFGQGDLIDLAYLPFPYPNAVFEGLSWRANATGDGGTLEIVGQDSGGNPIAIASVGFSGVHLASDFFIESDGHGGTLIGSNAPALTTASWTTAQNGTWQTAADWSTNAVPNANTNAQISATGANYKITDAQDSFVYSLTTVKGATLDITGGTFRIYSGTGAGTSGGVVKVEAAGTLDIAGDFEQVKTGSIEAAKSGGVINLNAGWPAPSWSRPAAATG